MCIFNQLNFVYFMHEYMSIKLSENINNNLDSVLYSLPLNNYKNNNQKSWDIFNLNYERLERIFKTHYKKLFI